MRYVPFVCCMLIYTLLCYVLKALGGDDSGDEIYATPMRPNAGGKNLKVNS